MCDFFYSFREMRRKKSGLQKLVLDWSNSALRSKHMSANARRMAPARKLSQWQTSVAKKTICKKYKESLGFSERTVFLSRGDPIAAEVLRFLAGYDIVIHESFGQPENCGLLTANIPKRSVLFFICSASWWSKITLSCSLETECSCCCRCENSEIF